MLLVGAIPVVLLIFSASASTAAKNAALAVTAVFAVGLIAWRLWKRATRLSISEALGDLGKSNQDD